jgi:predicted O-methyltransferase YrrM
MDFPLIHDAYASHLCLLSELGGIRDGVKRVLELGSGIYSTPLFLNKEFYPYVIEVVSIEHNPDWADIVRAKCPDDRLKLIVVPEPTETYLETLDLDSFDLIFVDNSDSFERRIKTIEYLGRVCTDSLVVFHDFQFEPYQESAMDFPNKIIDKRSPTHTAIAWKGGPINFRGELCLNKVIE